MAFFSFIWVHKITIELFYLSSVPHHRLIENWELQVVLDHDNGLTHCSSFSIFWMETQREDGPKQMVRGELLAERKLLIVFTVFGVGNCTCWSLWRFFFTVTDDTWLQHTHTHTSDYILDLDDGKRSPVHCLWRSLTVRPIALRLFRYHRNF